MQIGGDSITIRQRPAAAQAMRDQALRAVLQVGNCLGGRVSNLHSLSSECKTRQRPTSAHAMRDQALCAGLQAGEASGDSMSLELSVPCVTLHTAASQRAQKT